MDEIALSEGDSLAVVVTQYNEERRQYRIKPTGEVPRRAPEEVEALAAAGGGVGGGRGGGERGGGRGGGRGRGGGGGGGGGRGGGRPRS